MKRENSRLLLAAVRKTPVLTGLRFLLLIFMAALPMVITMLLADLIDGIGTGAFSLQQSSSLLLLLSLCFVLTLQKCAPSIDHLLKDRQERVLNPWIELTVTEKITTIPYAALEDRKAQDRIARLKKDPYQ